MNPQTLFALAGSSSLQVRAPKTLPVSQTPIGPYNFPPHTLLLPSQRCMCGDHHAIHPWPGKCPTFALGTLMYCGNPRQCQNFPLRFRQSNTPDHHFVECKMTCLVQTSISQLPCMLQRKLTKPKPFSKNNFLGFCNASTDCY